MSTTSLLNAADTVGRMIKAARVDIARGREVSLAGIEQVMAGIYRRVAEDREVERRDERSDLARRLGALLGELDALEGDLTARYHMLAGAAEAASAAPAGE